MAAHPRYPFARHIRNEIARDIPVATGMLDPMAHAMAMAASLAVAMGRHVFVLNVGDARQTNPGLLSRQVDHRLDGIEDDLSAVVASTGVGIVWKRKDGARDRARDTFLEILDVLTEEAAEGAFLVDADSDGFVSVHIVDGYGKDAKRYRSSSIHSDDA